jgi:DNA-binding MarR family transcriptional regulator
MLTILKQRVALLEKENAELREQAPRRDSALGHDTARVLVHLFQANDIDDRDVRTMAQALGMEIGVLKYHLDRLDQAGFASVSSGNYVTGAMYWSLSPEGRRKVVEGGLV